MLRRVIILITLLLLLAAPLHYWYTVTHDHVRSRPETVGVAQNVGESEDGQEAENSGETEHGSSADAVAIPPGTSLRGIADILLEEDVISDGLMFRVCAKLSGEAAGLRSGYYAFPDTLSIVRVLEILSDGSHQAVRRITFPEGYTVRQMAGVIGKQIGLSAEEFIRLSKDRSFMSSFGIRAATLEGYLLPETYVFRYDADERSILSHMISQLQNSLTARDTASMKKLGVNTHRILTMASLVEGETNLDRERARVAGVYYNRLRRGMLLQADPTIQFIIKDGPRRLLYRDLTINSPYNTYMHAGLPPGPVNNPGIASIKAALYPESHDLLYFVADGKGGHRFSRTFEEHGRAVSQYRAIQRTRRK